jgi:hypothetical protein
MGTADNFHVLQEPHNVLPGKTRWCRAYSYWCFEGSAWWASARAHTCSPQNIN